MDGPPLKVKMYSALGVFLLSVVSGLVVYQTPPHSWNELSLWMWQPSLQGLITALGVLGINAGLRPK
jgi:hypothetical protein